MKPAKLLSSRTLTGTLCILSPLIFSFAIALDIYVPSIPTIQNYFHVSQAMMQLTVSLFLLITGFAQLIMGPFSDQIGRRKIALFSIALLVIGSLLCALAWDMSFLIMGRMVQALGACGMMVTCFAIVRDLFSEEECARVYSFLNSTISLSPLLAPLVGGYLAYFFNWRASFIFLAIIAALIFLSTYRNLNETLAPKNKRNLEKEFLLDYLHVLKNPCFRVYTFAACAGFACFLTFFSSSSYIIINLLHIPEQHFGFYFAAIGIVFFFSSLLGGYTAQKLGIYKTVLMGGVLILLAGCIMLLWYRDEGLSIYAFMCPMMIMGIGGAFVMGAGAGGAISPFPTMAGTASALFGCLQFVFAFIISQVVLQWQVNSTVPLSITLIALGGITTLLTAVSYKKLHKKNLL